MTASRYLNTWGEPLIGDVYPPRSRSGYAHFSGHIYAVDAYAPLTATAAEARAYYDSQGVVVADVEVADDDTGILLTGESVCAARPLGGDWRLVDGAIELIAIVMGLPYGPDPDEPVERSQDGPVPLDEGGAWWTPSEAGE